MAAAISHNAGDQDELAWQRGGTHEDGNPWRSSSCCSSPAPTMHPSIVDRCPLDWPSVGHAEEALIIDAPALDATGSFGRRREHATPAAKPLHATHR
jgi:hypothetical protein